MKFLYSFIMVLFISSLSFAGAKSNCTISIKSHKKNGETLTIVFHTKLKNQKECRTLATMHQKNFTPDTVQSKQVSFGWSGMVEKQKRSAMVARSSRKNFRKRNNF